ncbi:MAG TPA: CDP-diacylglycerol--glycerol-3-phosphate 3-phosphatidyltransferase [Actinomycetes bacterium]|nr:CDP-diacylglycerol--glycerol-3-phosphate 3-phosphatidyltransferase [Actinomycetes bacterium]
MADPVGSASAWNLANALTVLRLALVPVFVLVAVPGFSGDDDQLLAIATAVFLGAAFTDLIDGEIARRRHLITTFGKVADPIADKALTGAALIVLSAFDQLPWWVTVVIIGREVLVTVLRLWVIQHGVIPASRGGKLKTALQITAISLYLLPLPADADVLPITVMALAVLVTVVTGFDYVARALRLRRAALAVQA